jgi:hypothetical protein
VSARQGVERIVDCADGTIVDRACPTAALGERVEAHIGGDAVEPRAQPRSPVEAVEAPPSAEHGFLYGVVGLGSGAEDAVALAGQRAAVWFQQRGGIRR